VNQEWPKTKTHLEEMHWRFEYRTRCKGEHCRKTIEFWKTASLPARFIPLEQAFATDPTQMVPHHMLCPDATKFREPTTAQDMRDEKRSRGDDRSVILRLLKEAGPAGVTNQKLTEVSMRFGARIYELRKEGYDIKTKNEKRGVFRFILRGMQKPQQELFV
jgi:hypothetical protein